MNKEKKDIFQTLLIPKVTSVFVILGAMGVLLVWVFNLEILKRLIPDLVSMKFNTALSFILVGIYVWLEQAGLRKNKYINYLTLLCLLLVALIALTTLLEYIPGYSLGIDELVIKERVLEGISETGEPYPGRMSSTSAINFLLICVSLLFSRFKNKYAIYLSQVIILITGQISLACLIGYIYGADFSYGIGQYIRVSVHTLISFLTIFLGIFFLYPNEAIASIITSNYYGTFLANRLLAFAVLVPFVLGLLRVVGEKMGLYESVFGAALYCSLTIGMLALVILWQAFILNQSDIERKEKEIALEKSEQKLQAILDNSTAIIFLKDLEGRFLLINQQFEKTFSISRQELIGKTVYNFFPKELADIYADNDLKAVNAGEALEYEEEALQKGEKHIYLSIKFPLHNSQGEVYGLAGISTDITHRKQIENELRNTKEKLEEIIKERTKKLAESNEKLKLEIIENKRSQEEIKELNEELERRVRERTIQLEATNKELEAFSYSVSHDLRAPLRHVSGFIELLKKSNVNSLNEKSQHYIKVITEASKKMGVLIDELLSFSRMGRSELRNTKVNLKEMVESLVKAYQEPNNDRKINWVIGTLPIVQADRAMLELVFNNLISNALKYSSTKEESIIEIGVNLDLENEVIIFVRDNGVGFDMQYSKNLFGVFQRLHKAEEFEGVGIGLANVRRIIHRHGGRTWAESILGQGATFYFSLPIKLEGTL